MKQRRLLCAETNHRHAIEVIASTHHRYKSGEGLGYKGGDLRHNFSLFIITVSTLFISVGAFRQAIPNLQPGYQNGSMLCDPTAIYVCWGLMEVIVNAFCIFGSDELRFYRPERLHK